MRQQQRSWMAGALLAGAATAAGISGAPQQAMAADYSVGSAKDNTLYENAAGNISLGAGDGMFAGRVGFNGQFLRRRALIKFDLASKLPAGSWIQSASLTLNCSQAAFNVDDISLYRVSADWGEGTSDSFGGGGSGAAATDNDATWIYRFYSTTNLANAPKWNNAGGDYSSTPSATTTVNFSGSYTWGSNAAMVADVQSFLDSPANNFGWMLKGVEFNPDNSITNNNAKRFDTKEVSFGTPPSLRVHYLMGGDANGDDKVDLTDFTFLASNFNKSNQTFADGDFNRDGKVDLTDFTILAANFNKMAPNNAPPPGATVPEPLALPLLAVAAAATTSRRRRGG